MISAVSCPKIIMRIFPRQKLIDLPYWEFWNCTVLQDGQFAALRNDYWSLIFSNYNYHFCEFLTIFLINIAKMGIFFRLKLLKISKIDKKLKKYSLSLSTANWPSCSTVNWPIHGVRTLSYKFQISIFNDIEKQNNYYITYICICNLQDSIELYVV